jgi:hypothetical protein
VLCVKTGATPRYLLESPACVSQTSPFRPPKGTDPGPCGFFPANRDLWEPPEGAMITVTDSWARRQTSPLLPQRERGPRTQEPRWDLCSSPLQISRFLRARNGGHDAFVDPLWLARLWAPGTKAASV